jgi:excisionase family DNA binding protein
VPHRANNGHCTVAMRMRQGTIAAVGGVHMQEQLAVNIPEAARRLGLSIRTVATLVSRRQLASRKVGRRRIIPVEALEAFVRDSDSPKAGDTGSTENSGERR